MSALSAYGDCALPSELDNALPRGKSLLSNMRIQEQEEDTFLNARVTVNSDLDTVLLPDVDPELLAVVFSACEAQTLLRVEVALGSHLGFPLRANSLYMWNWIKALRHEAGLNLTTGWEDSDGDHVHSSLPLHLIPKKESLMAALEKARFSLPLEGGWRCIHPDQLSSCASVLGRLHAMHPHGREIRNPDSGVSWGCAERIGTPVHFDALGCFKGETWKTIENAFRTNSPLPAGEPWRASSSSVCHSLAGRSISLSLSLRSFSSTSNFEGPEGGIFFGLDMHGLEALFIHRGDGRFPLLGIDDIVHVAYVIKCGSTERKGGHLLKYYPRAGQLAEISYQHPWHFAPMPNMGIALRIDVEHGSEEGLQAFCIDEELVNAHWNSRGIDRTEMAPLRLLQDNEFAARPLAPGSLTGCVALVRRGGGCGFAQKALAVQDAGAVACIIYEAHGDQEMLGKVLIMGAHYQGTDYPFPDIPTLLVTAADGVRLLAATSGQGGANARVCLGRTITDLRRPPQSFQEFQRHTAEGEPVHVAVLIEALRNPTCEAGVWGPQVSWFQGPTMRRPDPNDANWVEVAEVMVLLGEMP
jgi:hypothetical protein